MKFLFRLFSVLLLLSCSPPEEIQFNKLGVSFTIPAGWKVTDEDDLGGKGYYLACEKEGAGSSGLVTVSWANDSLDLSATVDQYAQEQFHLPTLDQFLPPNTFSQVSPYFRDHTIHLTLTHQRKSVHGDYRAPSRDRPYHRISVNATLNPYSFLITLLHELAHMLTFVHFKNNVSPHGREWKAQFRHTLIPFMSKRIFPPDVEKALHAYLHDPAASTCADPHLYKALHRYNAPRPGWKFVDELRVNQQFETEDGRRFQKLEVLRTRSRCKEVGTGRMYFFQGIVEVKVL